MLNSVPYIAIVVAREGLQKAKGLSVKMLNALIVAVTHRAHV